MFNSPQSLMALLHKMLYQPSPVSLDSWKGYQLTDLGFDSISPLHKFPAQFLGKRRADRQRILSDSNHLVHSYLYGVIVRHSDRQGPRGEEGYCHLDAIWHDVIRSPQLSAIKCTHTVSSWLVKPRLRGKRRARRRERAISRGSDSRKKAHACSSLGSIL